MEPILAVCPSCQKQLRVPADKAGRRIKCPQCHQPVTVPDETPADGDELTVMQWVTITGAVVMVLSVAFFFVRPSGQAWRVVGLIGLVAIAIPHHKEIWARVKRGAVRLTQRKPVPETSQAEMSPQPPPPGPVQQVPQPHNTQQQRHIVIQEANRGGCVPGCLSLLIPGLGHVASGRVGAGFLWFIVCVIGSLILWPTIVGPFLLYALCVFDAASGGKGKTTVVVT